MKSNTVYIFESILKKNYRILGVFSKYGLTELTFNKDRHSHDVPQQR